MAPPAVAMRTLFFACVSACAAGGATARTDGATQRDAQLDSTVVLPDAGRDAAMDSAVVDGASDSSALDSAVPVDAASDAAMDSSLPTDATVDAGVDAGNACATCNDGNACNGVERCVDGVCLPGTAVVCDDAVACTTNACDPATGSCRYTADNARCVSPQTCDMTRGCVDPVCTGSPCGLLPQCGCAGGQACYPNGMSTVCDSAGSIPVAASCPAASGCVRGAECFSIGGDETNVCLEFCRSRADCHGGPGAACYYNIGQEPVRGCSLDCDPMSGARCPAGTRCRLGTSTTDTPYTVCRAPTGAGGQGSACVASDACALGYVCQAGQCMRWCDPNSASPGCPSGTVCLRFTEPLLFSSREYGVCNVAP